MRTFLVLTLCASCSDMLATAAPNAHVPPRPPTARSLLEGVGDPMTRSLLELMLTEQEAVRADLKRAEAEIIDLRGQLDARRAEDTGAVGRRLVEEPGPEPISEPDQAEPQMIYRRTLLTSHKRRKKRGKDGTQHRRAQQLCSKQEVPTRLGEVTDECCNEPEEDCSTGRMRVWPSSSLLLATPAQVGLTYVARPSVALTRRCPEDMQYRVRGGGALILGGLPGNLHRRLGACSIFVTF